MRSKIEIGRGSTDGYSPLSLVRSPSLDWGRREDKLDSGDGVENETVEEARERMRSMVSMSLASSLDRREAADGTRARAGPASGEERAGREEEGESGGAGVR